MTERISPDDLLQRYVHDIGSRLPSKDRTDVTKELESLLSETIEEKGHKTGKAPDSALVSQVLRDFGSPEEVAARYCGRPTYLIGPNLYPAFIRTLKLVFLIAGIITLVLAALSTLSLVRPGASTADVSALSRWFDVFWNFAWSTFGIAVVVFAVIERNWSPAFKQKVDWNPSDLPPVDDPNRVSLVSTTFRIYGIVVLFLIFNLFTDRLGILFIDSLRGPRMITLSELGVSFPILLLDIWWLIALARNLFLLYQGRESRMTRWGEFGLGLLGAGILFSILKDVSFAIDQNSFIEAVGNQTLADMTGRVALLSLGIGLLFVLISSAKRLYRLLRDEFRESTT